MRLGIVNDLPRLRTNSPIEALDMVKTMLEEWHQEQYGTKAGSDTDCYTCAVCKVVRKMEKKIAAWEDSRNALRRQQAWR